ncbi:hemerythrin domain-containing protein [Euzebya sp.]|uniref:hemerythrin domain-containing protein n=1 Tax=Euzebya sp. TaxID=1971409 RepID=UPI00351232AC
MDHQLLVRLDDLAVVTPALPELSPGEVRSHLDQVRGFLHDEVLAHASAEELALFPVLERTAGPRVVARLAVEHDTVRLAVAELDAVAARPMTGAQVRRTQAVLLGIEALLHGHLAHEVAAGDLPDPNDTSRT